MNKLFFIVAAVGGLVWSQAEYVCAAEGAPAWQTEGEWGDSTRAWLDVQRSGQEAGLTHPLGAEAANLGHQRYLKSFTHPIPEFYRPPQEGFKSGGGGGGGSGGRR